MLATTLGDNKTNDVTATKNGTSHTYTYDSWGMLLSTTGSLASTVGAANPLRYRGYYYDTETGLYYLQSRYYDPQVGRFISADAFASTGQGIVGFNMYAYCLNNPVVYVDPSGAAVGGIIAGVIISAIISTVEGLIDGKTGSKLLTYVLWSTAIGGLAVAWAPINVISIIVDTIETIFACNKADAGLFATAVVVGTALLGELINVDLGDEVSNFIVNTVAVLSCDAVILGIEEGVESYYTTQKDQRIADWESTSLYDPEWHDPFGAECAVGVGASRPASMLLHAA